MAIEFHCSSCQSRLRTPDDAAGKAARCPNCGSIEPIPQQSLPDLAPSNTGGAVDILDQAREEAFFPASGQLKQEWNNPYAGPSSLPPNQPVPYGGFYYQPTRESARQKLMAPAIVLIVLSSLGLVFCLLGFAGFIVEVANNQFDEDSVGGAIVLGVFGGLAMITLIGSISMLRMRGYALSLIGAIASILMGLGCCLLPAGIGIWALIVLVDPHVKRFFH